MKPCIHTNTHAWLMWHDEGDNDLPTLSVTVVSDLCCNGWWSLDDPTCDVIILVSLVNCLLEAGSGNDFGNSGFEPRSAILSQFMQQHFDSHRKLLYNTFAAEPTFPWRHPPVGLRLRSNWYEYEYEFRVRVSVYGLYKLHPHEWAFMVTCTRTTQCVSTDNLQLNRIERMLCENSYNISIHR